MILVTLGTQKFAMNRLVEAIDQIAPNYDEKFFIQTGHSTYEPKNCEFQPFVDKEVFQKMIAECSLLITHSGVGSIITGINANRPVIVVPRLAKYHEHVDDHQVQIARAFASKKNVLACENLEKLPQYIEKAREYQFAPYVVEGGKIEDIILDYLKIFD